MIATAMLRTSTVAGENDVANEIGSIAISEGTNFVSEGR
jgi:hypothetical protein